MKPISKLQLWLLALATGGLVAIFIVPPTGWSARDMLWQMTDQSRAELFGPSDSTLQLLAARHPTDFDLRLLEAKPQALGDVILHSVGNSPDDEISKTSEIVRRVDSLCNQFPNQPSAFANAIRFESNYLPYPEWMAGEQKVFGAGTLSGRATDLPKPDYLQEAILRDFIRLAKDGETLDPMNAYFPWMLADAYFANRQNTLAIESIELAGTDTTYSNYSSDELFASWHVREVVDGGISGVERLNSVALSPIDGYPDSAKLRGVARMATFLAMEDELSGDAEDGIKIRLAIMHFGALQRVYGQTLIDNLIGIAISNIATDRPDGREFKQNMALKEPERWEERSRIRNSFFESYARENGYPDAAKWIKSELDVEMAEHNTMIKFSGNLIDLKALVLELYVELAMILAVIWALLAVIGFAKSAVVGYWLKPKQDRKFSWQLACWIGLWVVTAVLAIWLLIYAIPGAQALTQFAPDNSNGSDNNDGPNVMVYVITVAAIFGPAMLYMLITSMVARIRKRPLIKSLVNVTFAISLPIISMLLIVISGLALFYVNEDIAISRPIVARATFGEGQYTARKLGIPWPGLVPQAPPRT